MIFIETDDPTPLLRTTEELGIDPKTVVPATVQGFTVDERVYEALIAAKAPQDSGRTVNAKRRGRPPKKAAEAGIRETHKDSTEVHDG